MTSTESIERRLTRGGYRLTGPRRALVDTMQQMGDHFTAEEVLDASPGVGRATVFRTLRLLQDLEVVCQVVMDDGSIAYRLDEGPHHHHVVCTDCGAVTNFESTAIEGLIEEVALETGYLIEAHRLELYGRCPACRERDGDDGAKS
jgi:Fur family transcriptional regulator, ferric uptake regulator